MRNFESSDGAMPFRALLVLLAVAGLACLLLVPQGGGLAMAALVAVAGAGGLASRAQRQARALGRANCALAEEAAALAAAKARAEEADRAKSAFLANMSHELRTPMNGVVGMAELLAAGACDERQRSQAEVIVRSAGALLTIVNDILDFAKIEAGEVTFDREPFALGDAVGDVTELFAIACRRKGLSLSVRVAPGLPERYIGDRGRFCQVLTNLVGNAVKFTDRGSVVIDVRDAAATGGSGLLVAVADSGIGIPEDKREAVFEKFRQVDNTTKASRQGTGLGLAISRMLVEQMGGRIGVDSRLGEGSTFWFSLPLQRDDAAPASLARRRDDGRPDRRAA
ncbi:MAG TPA: ATP-binding protein [Afifellaceae bacterium]|nr:ATP-binding protein [Afifellaceae bacterium]